MNKTTSVVDGCGCGPPDDLDGWIYQSITINYTGTIPL